MKYHLINPLVWFFLLSGTSSYAQISFDDPLTVIISPEGKTLKKADLEGLLSDGKQFSMAAIKKGDTTIYHLAYKSEAEIAEKNKLILNLKKTLVGKRLPPFSLNTVNEETITNTTISGKLTVLNFWFIGCKPCIDEIPELNELADEYKGMVNFIAPGLDSKEQLAKFLAQKEFKYITLYSSKPFNDAIGVESYPMHLLIDEKGILKEVIFGASANIKERLTSSIEQFLSN